MWARMLQKLFASHDESKEVAKSRLHFVLVQDRSGLNPDELGKFRAEMIGVIEKYFVIDENEFDISYQRGEEMTTLVINSPVVLKRPAASEKKTLTVPNAGQLKPGKSVVPMKGEASNDGASQDERPAKGVSVVASQQHGASGNKPGVQKDDQQKAVSR